LLRLLVKLFFHIHLKGRWKLFLLILLTIFVAFFEVLGIASIYPFLGVLLNPDLKSNNSLILIKFDNLISFFSVENRLLFFAATFCVLAIVTGVMRVLLIWLSTRVSSEIGCYLAAQIYKRTLYQSYSIHISRNSSELIDGLTTKINAIINGVIAPLVTAFSALVMALIIGLSFLMVNHLVTLILIVTFGLIYFLLAIITKSMKINNSQIISNQSIFVIKLMQEGLGGIRDIILGGYQRIFCNLFEKANHRLQNARASNQFLALTPRYVIESFVMVCCGLIVFNYVSNGNDLNVLVPVAGAMFLAIQKLLPILQQLYSSWSSLQSNHASLVSVLDFLGKDSSLHKINLIPRENNLMDFDSTIELSNIFFKYDSSPKMVLRDITLKLQKNKCYGFMGATGGGKSTLLDIIMGLQHPTAGNIRVDGVVVDSSNCHNWQKHIAHVPQFIFLIDASLIENIAFGVEPHLVNLERVYWAAKKACIDDVINSLPNKYGTILGERGIKFSGGQRQRIGIARALYGDADVIVLDEATSALDLSAEARVMMEIQNLSKDLTIILVAHRLATLSICDQIYEIKDGAIVTKQFE
jgi:ABC-type multidrug transport system fused ATPase/permease subunit